MPWPRKSWASITRLRFDSSLKGERGTNLVGARISSARRDLKGVERETKGGLDARTQGLGVAEGQDTGVVDLGLDERSVVKVGLGTDLEVHVAGSLRVVGGAGAGLNVGIHAVVVRGAVGRQVAESVQRDGVLRSVEASSQVVAGQLLVLGAVGGLGTEQEAVTADHGIGGQQRALEGIHKVAHMHTGRLVGERHQGVLRLLLRHERRDHLELQALGDVVLQLNVVAEHIGSRPGLRESQTLLAVGPARLQVAADGRRLVVVQTQHFEGHTRGRARLHLQGRAVDRVVLTKDVGRGLTEVLPAGRHGNRHGDVRMDAMVEEHSGVGSGQCVPCWQHPPFGRDRRTHSCTCPSRVRKGAGGDRRC